MYMQKNKPYKYREIEPGDDVVFLLVIKPLHWINSPGDTLYGDSIPVGAVTWISKKSGAILNLKNEKSLRPDYSVHPENNKYCANFDPSCFELLVTSKQKIK